MAAVIGTLQAIKYRRGHLQVLDQLRLPHEFHYDDISTCEDAFDCIRSMRVRGAPAIAIVAALALAVELLPRASAWPKDPEADTDPDEPPSMDDVVDYINGRLDYLKESRPTAVDLSNAVAMLKFVVRSSSFACTLTPHTTVINHFIAAAEEIFRRDTETNLAIGKNGAEWLKAQASASPNAQISVLTHCNTGSLATSGHGTALGIIRSLYAGKLLKHAFCTETRPYNQGSRLTAFELTYEKIPSTLITDSMAGALFSQKKGSMNIAAVIVGADRVVRNGDTANKIGTYSLAVLARHHAIKFVVAAPTTSIDLETETGAGINIEERSPQELTQVKGAVVYPDGKVDTSRSERVATADQTVAVWNPAFDVTPHDLIDAIVTEKGVVERNADGVFEFKKIMPERWAATTGEKRVD